MVDIRFKKTHSRFMKDDLRFINELFRIVNGALRLDVDKVRNYTAFLADKLEQHGDAVPAHRLRKMLEESDHQLRPTDARVGRTVPVDEESRFPLVERVNLSGALEPAVFLPQAQWDVVNEFLSIAKSYGQIVAQDVAGDLSLLMFGPPGTGKTRLARFIAKELGLELYIARLDGLISSFLGSTSKNIRALFDFAAKTPCVLFLDEFDAIAKLRGDTQELGELKRVVNSFIQNLDTLGRQTIILAATNHESLLDSAVWRRFSYRLELTLPEAGIRRQMWLNFLQPIAFADRDLALLVDLSDGFSGSDIHDVCLRLKRREVTTRKTPSVADAFQVLRNLAVGTANERRFMTALGAQDQAGLAQALRLRNAKLYSHAALAELLGISKATAYRLTQKEAAAHGG